MSATQMDNTQAPSRPVTVGLENFRQVVLEAGDTPVLVDFWAPWCGPCRAVAPVLEEIAAEWSGRAVVAKVDVDEQQQLAASAGIRSIPTLVVFHRGEVSEVLIGAQPKARLEAALQRTTTVG